MCLNWSWGAVVAIGFGAAAAVHLVKQLLPLRWRSTTGTVTGHRVRAGMGAGESQDFEGAPVYSYQVDGKSLTGDHLGVVQHFSGHTRASALAQMESRFPVGSQLPVYYDPNDHTRSAVDIQIRPWGALVGFAAAAIFAMASRMFDC